MADGVAITAGSGTTVATDDVTGVHYQRMKLVDGTLDGTDAIPGSAARGLHVDPRELLTEVAITSSGLTTATTAYIAGDVLGTELTLTGMARANAGYFTIVEANLVDKANVVGTVDAFLFNAASTPAADNAANAWSDANMANLLGVIHLGDLVTSANNRVLRGVNLPLVGKCAAGTTSIFMVLVTRGAHTFFGAAGDLVGRLQVIQH